MAQVLVRNLDERTVKRLKNRARRSGNSLQAEARSILEEAADMEARMQSAWKRLDAIRKRFEGRHFDDSAKIIRKDRERR